MYTKSCTQTITQQAPLSMGSVRQEYWSGLPFPSPGDLPNPQIEFVSPALTGGFFTTELPGNPNKQDMGNEIFEGREICLTWFYKVFY